MKKVLFFSLILFFSSIPLLCQEVVVFSDDRSMTVKSHREKEGFVYLQLPEGEIAVPKKQIKEIRNEKVSSVNISDTSPSAFVRESIIDQSTNLDRGRKINHIKSFSAKSQPVEQTRDDEDEDDGEDVDNDSEEDEDISPAPRNDTNKPNLPRLSPAMQLPQKPQRDNTTGPVLRKR